jgi:hypothetical protein
MSRSNHVGHVCEGVLNSSNAHGKTCEDIYIYMMWTMKVKNNAS